MVNMWTVLVGQFAVSIAYRNQEKAYEEGFTVEDAWKEREPEAVSWWRFTVSGARKVTSPEASVVAILVKYHQKGQYLKLVNCFCA